MKTTQSRSPRAFISHSHEDKPTARDIAEALRKKGVDAWFDEWEINPGDSLVQKIFEEGLKDCELFLILLSPASVASAWVRHELDSAIIQRLSGATRVIPIVVISCEIPVALRPLLRLDLTTASQDDVIDRLVDVAFGRDQRPPLGPTPSGLNINVPGLSNHAARMATTISGSMDQSDGRPMAFPGPALAEALSLNPQQINEGVEELEALGLVRTTKWLGTAPFSFGQVEPTPSLALQLRGTGALDYDPEDDIRVIAAAIAQRGEVDGPGIQSLTHLSPSRINRAVSYLEDYNIVQVMKFLGTAPFSFGIVRATTATRRFLSDNSSQ